MEEKSQFFSVFEHLQDYVSNKAKIFYLKAVSKTTSFFAQLISNALLMLVLSFFMLFSSLGLALFLGSLFKQMHWGFIIVSGFYLVLFLTLFFFRKQFLELKITNVLIRNIFAKPHANE